MPQNTFFPWTHNLLVSQKMTQRHFFSTLHPLSLGTFATATLVLLCNSTFSFHCYTQCEAMPSQKLAWKRRCNLLRKFPVQISKDEYPFCPQDNQLGNIFSLNIQGWSSNAIASSWAFVYFPLVISSFSSLVRCMAFRTLVFTTG